MYYRDSFLIGTVYAEFDAVVRFVYCLCSLVLAASCVGEEPTDGNGDGEAQTSTLGRLSTNGLELQRGGLAELATAPLAFSATTAMASTASGPELLSYVARCALDRTQSISFVVDGVTHVVAGRLGYAPQWADEPCDEDCQQWVTACLLAHANATQRSVAISLRSVGGPALSDYEAEHFTIQEAAFYGNLFTSESPIFACVGRGVTNPDPDGPDHYLKSRMCARTGRCGLRTTGHCVHKEMPRACAVDAGLHGAFTDCMAGKATDELYHRVVTVYLKE